jgi:site-specific recombinase XerD
VSALRRKLNDYLALRRALGFKLEHPAQLLSRFVDYLERRRASYITIEHALAWAKQPPSGHPSWWAERLGAIRCFAEHIKALDPRTEIPARDLLPHVPCRAIPYLYSAEDTLRIIDAARSQLSPFRAHTYVAIVGLLWSTGMRIGEVISLDRADVDWSHAVLVVRTSKARRSREIPIHATVVAALLEYARLRDDTIRRPAASTFFLSSRGTRLNYKNVQHCFQKLTRTAGLRLRAPRLDPGFTT